MKGYRFHIILLLLAMAAPQMSFGQGGCTIEFACNFDPMAETDDGSCDFVSCLTFGCTDGEACNYDEEALYEDGSCDYPLFPYGCDGNCIQDDDMDGVCDEYEIFGCSDALACNFLTGATNDDGSCFYDCAGCTIIEACNFDSGALDDDGSCEFESCQLLGCLDLNACNFTFDAVIDDGSCIYPLDEECDCEGNVPDAIGACGGDCPLDEDEDGVCDVIYGCTIATACNYNPEATDYTATCDFFSCLVFGCTYENACNYDVEANYNDGSCEFVSCAGCMNALACDFDPSALIPALCYDFQSCYGCTSPSAGNFDPDVTIDDGSCQVLGCTNEVACNYDELANYDDGTCDFVGCLVQGCVDQYGCNFDPNALLPGACDYPEPGYACDGACLVDNDGDGVCDPFEISGCTDEAAFNFNPTATEDNGSCIPTVAGCSDVEACNYSFGVNLEDGSCDYESCVGCLDDGACNYDSEAVQAGECAYPEAGYDCFGSCILDLNGNGICDPLEVNGCMYITATNYDPEASFDNGSCVFSGCTSEGFDSFSPFATEEVGDACFSLPILADFNLDGIVQLVDFADFLVALGQSYPDWSLDWLGEACVYGEGVALEDFSGCTYPNAWNYDPAATADLNTCLFPGCKDSTALNFDALANISDGSCFFTPCPDLNRDQTIDIQDMLDFFQKWGLSY